MGGKIGLRSESGDEQFRFVVVGRCYFSFAKGRLAKKSAFLLLTVRAYSCLIIVVESLRLC
jgi:hypothetical protein